MYLILISIIVILSLLIFLLVVNYQKKITKLKEKIKEQREKIYFEIGFKIFNVTIDNFLNIFENPNENLNIPLIINELISSFSQFIVFFAEQLNLLTDEISKLTIEEKEKILNDIKMFENLSLPKIFKEKSKEIKTIEEKINFIKKRVNKYLSIDEINEIYNNIKIKIFSKENLLNDQQKQFLFLFFTIFYNYLINQQNISVQTFVIKILNFIKSLFE